MIKNKRILVVDDHPVVLMGLAAQLGDLTAGCQILQATNGAAALQLAGKEAFHLAVIDFSLPDITCTDFIRQLRECCPQLRIVLYTAHDEPWVIREMQSAGVDAVVLKDDNMGELRKALQAIERGETYFSGRFTEVATQQACSITSREIDILRCMSAGMDSHEISRRLCVSENTVEYHRKKLMRRFGALNSANLVSIAIGRGLIEGSGQKAEP